jgi:hypothetical protein
VRTRDLVDTDGNGIMNLSAGDAVMVHWQDFNEEILTNESLTPDERADYLIARGFQPPVAQAIASGYQRLIGKQRPLRLNEWTYDYSWNQGIEIEMELVDFVMVEGVRMTKLAAFKEITNVLKGIGF